MISNILIGLTGAFILLVMWMFEVYDSVRKHRAEVDLKILLMYFIGSCFLAFYAFSIEDPVFLPLKLGIISLVLFEIAYAIHFKFEKTRKLYGNRGSGKNKRR